jgi:plasmid stabilization system protein ParE
MTGYALHPEARFDLDEIWELIRADNLDAADRMITEILAAVTALVPLPGQGRRRPDLTAFAIHTGTRIFDWLRARRKAVVGCSDHAWTPQPSRDGRDPKKPRISPRCYSE